MELLLHFVAEELEAHATWTIRAFCGCNSTPSCFRIRPAISTAARASAADLQVITQSSANLVSNSRTLIERPQPRRLNKINTGFYVGDSRGAD
jgi:hypothetical protein